MKDLSKYFYPIYRSPVENAFALANEDDLVVEKKVYKTIPWAQDEEREEGARGNY